jgi:hypothetical protein
MRLADEAFQTRIGASEDSSPRLTGVSSQEDCAYKLRSLEVKLNARVCTIKDRGVLEQFVPTPLERIVEYDPPVVKWSIRAELEALMREVEKITPVGGKKRKWVAVPSDPPGGKGAENIEAAEDAGQQTEEGGAMDMEVEKLAEGGAVMEGSGDGAVGGGPSEEVGKVGVVESGREEGGRTLHWKRREEGGGKSTTLLQKLGSILYVLDELGQWFAYKVRVRPGL